MTEEIQPQFCNASMRRCRSTETEPTEEWSATRKCLLPMLFKSIQTMSISMMEQGALYMQTICASHTQYSAFLKVEDTIKEPLDKLTKKYYRINSLRANPEKTQFIAFPSPEQGGNDIAGSSVERDTYGEYPSYEILRCNT